MLEEDIPEEDKIIIKACHNTIYAGSWEYFKVKLLGKKLYIHSKSSDKLYLIKTYKNTEYFIDIIK